MSKAKKDLKLKAYHNDMLGVHKKTLELLKKESDLVPKEDEALFLNVLNVLQTEIDKMEINQQVKETFNE